jgi:hypothetical protein
MTDDKFERYLHVFENVRALYLVIKEAQEEHGLPLRRAALRSNGEVSAESIDFLCDVELKAKRVLPQIEFQMFKEGLEIPEWSKATLGEVFKKCRLGMGGDYKSLYFHVKKVIDGQPMNTIEYGKASNTTPSLEEYDRRTT